MLAASLHEPVARTVLSQEAVVHLGPVLALEVEEVTMVAEVVAVLSSVVR